MKRFFKLVGITMQSLMYYRASFFINLITPLVLLAGQFLLWSSLYGGNEGTAFGSYAQKDMFSYILLAFAITNLLTWSSENNLSRLIRNGEIVTMRIRPVPFLSQSVANMMGNLLLQGVVNMAVVTLAFVVFSRSLTLPTLQSFGQFLPALVLAVLLRMILSHCFSMLCFFTTDRLGIAWIREALMQFFSGAMIPVALFPAWLQSVSYATPFPLILQMPISILLGQPLPMALWQVYALQTVWILVFYGIHRLLLRYIERNTTIAGG